MLVLREADEAGHWKLGAVEAAERFAFQGHVFETADADGDGLLEVRPTGDVLGRVVNTFVRIAPEVIDADIEYEDGSTDTLTGTPNHPFWVPAVRDYVPLGKLEVGTVLHVQGGGEAILVSKTWRQRDFEVFDFEVEGLHNFYVRGDGSDAAGVLVHNSSTRLALTEGNDAMATIARGKVPKVDSQGNYLVVGHGNEQAMKFTTDGMATRKGAPEVADWIRGQPDYVEGQSVRLVSCNSGACDNGLAQGVANELGVNVTGATNPVELFDDGYYDAVWRTFSPQ